MKLKGLAILLQLILAAWPVLGAAADAKEPIAPEKKTAVKSSAFALKPKSRIIGVTLAIFPGILIHGTGHHYARKHGTALALHLVEAGAVSLIAVGAIGGYKDLKDIKDNLPTDISLLTKYEAMILGGAILFFSGWFYDIFGTPKAVASYNSGLNESNAGVSGYSPGTAQRAFCLATEYSLAGLDSREVAR